MSLNTILATTPLVSTNYILKATGTTIGNSLIWDNGTNVGIGNTNTSYTLEVTGTAKVSSTLLVSGAATLSSTLTTTGIGINYTGTLAAKLHITAASSTSYAPMIALRDPDNPTYGFTFKLDTAVNGDMRIDRVNAGTDAAVMSFQRSTGNVGIGTSSPASERKLTVAGGAQFTGGDNTGASLNIIPASTGQGGADFNLSYYTGTGYGPLTFTLGGSERMRITSGGDVCFGKTVYDNTTTGVSIADTKTTAIVSVVTDAGVSILCNRKTTTGQMFVFRYNGSNVGDISTNGSTITFSGNAVSDNRYKDNIEKIINAVDAINKVDWVTFKYKDNQRDSAGVTAQQLQTVPELLKFVIDGIDEDSYKAVDYNAIIGYLGAAIKEQNQLITSLQDRLTKGGL